MGRSAMSRQICISFALLVITEEPDWPLTLPQWPQKSPFQGLEKLLGWSEFRKLILTYLYQVAERLHYFTLVSGMITILSLERNS
jgi:hypothetical protein